MRPDTLVALYFLSAVGLLLLVIAAAVMWWR